MADIRRTSGGGPRRPSQRPRDFKEVNQILMGQARQLCEHLLPGGTIRGREYVCASIDGGRGRSFSVNLKSGQWQDFENPTYKGADLINLWAACKNVSQFESKKDCERWLGLEPVEDEIEREAPAERSVQEQDEEAKASAQPGEDPFWWRRERADKIWDYKDSGGNIVVQVKRWNARPDERKGKIVRPWDPNTGRYEWPKVDDRPLLYLDEIAHKDGPIVIVAGEKCADAVREVGYLSTTIMGGESAIAKTDFSPLLERDVILWPDNDPAGETWIEKLKAELKEAGVGTVRLVEIPADKPLKWDAADAEEPNRKNIIAKATLSSPVMRGIMAMRASELAKGDPPPRRWISRGGIPMAVPTILFGPGGVGKSLAVMDLCLKVAARSNYGSGIEADQPTFLGPVPIEAAGPTLFFTLEDDRDELHRRIHAIDEFQYYRTVPTFIVPALDIEGFDPTLVRQEGRAAEFTRLATSGLPQLIESIERRAGALPRLVALDPAGDFLDGSEDDAAIVKPLMRYFRELARRYGCAVILIGHSAKGQQDQESVISRAMRGSGAWTANARFAYGLYRPPYNQAVKLLKELDESITEKNLERVVFGRAVKSNQPSAVTGIRKYMQDPDSGLIIDRTATVQRSESKDENLKEQIFEAIKRAAELGYPFMMSGKTHGVWESPERCPPGPLREQKVGRDRVVALVNELKTEKRILVCRWNKKDGWLDIANGPVHKDNITPANSLPDDMYPDD